MSRIDPPPSVRTATVPAARTSGRSQAGRLIDPAALMRIKNLELRSRFVVQGFLSGLHRSPYHGFSVEFTEYRQYTPGDDLRYLDWRRLARSDRYYIKRFEDETNLRCWLLVDLSRSMEFGSLSYNKAAYAKTAAATIAQFLAMQRDAVGLVTFDAELRDVLMPRYRPGHLRRVLVCLEKSAEGASTDLRAPLDQVARHASKRGLVVLLSDLLAPIETLESQLAYVCSRGHEVVLLRILDPAEVDFSFDQPSLFQDAETMREVYLDPALARAEYMRRFSGHRAELIDVCRRLGVDVYDLLTSQPLELALFDLLSARQHKGRPLVRRRNPGRSLPAGRGA